MASKTTSKPWNAPPYNKTTAEQLLKDNSQGLLERMGSTYGSDKTKLADITARLKDAQQKWEKLRDADCAVDTFPASDRHQSLSRLRKMTAWRG